MSRRRALCTSLFLAATLAATLGACAGDDATMTPPPPGTPDEVEAQIADDLGRLGALEVVSVGELLVAAPAEGPSCYGACPEDVALAAERLHAVTDAAVDACVYASADPAQCTPIAIEANLAVLRDLQIVEIGDLLAVQPQNSPECYNLPCPADEQAAAAETCLRATKLGKIAAAVRDL